MKLTRRRIRKRSSRVKRQKIGRKTKNRRKSFRKKRTKGRRRRRSRRGGGEYEGWWEDVFRGAKKKGIKIFNMVKNGNLGEANEALDGDRSRISGIVEQLSITIRLNSGIDIENKITDINNAVKKGYVLWNNRFEIDDALWAQQPEASEVSVRDLMTHMEVWEREVMWRAQERLSEMDDIINDWTTHVLTP